MFRTRQQADSSTRRWLRRLVPTAVLVALAAVPVGLAGASSASAAAVPTRPCIAVVGGTTVNTGSFTLLSCSRVIRASVFTSAPAVGAWGNNLIAVDGTGSVYAQTATGWLFIGQDPSIRSLSDRCYAGDVGACSTWRNNVQFAIDSLNRLYPPGW